jgi:hypothetical protein
MAKRKDLIMTKKKKQQMAPEVKEESGQKVEESGQKVEKIETSSSTSTSGLGYSTTGSSSSSSCGGEQIKDDTDKEKHEPGLSEDEGKKKSVTPTPKWHFPDARQCPRCRGNNTEAYHTDVKKGRQYRRCRAPICRWKYSVNGRRTGG